MAVIKFILPTQPAGSDGGLTYYKNGQQLAMRSRAQQCKVRNGPSTFTRNLITVLSNFWESPLTPDNRAGWMAYAAGSPLTDAYGTPRYINGYAMYLRSNRPRLQFGLNRIDPPPPTNGFPTYTPPNYTLLTGGSNIMIEFTNTDEWATQDNAAMMIWASGPAPNYRTTPSERYAPATIILGSSTTPPTNPVIVAAPKLVQTELQTIWCRESVSDNTGRLST